jgi:integrase
MVTPRNSKTGTIRKNWPKVRTVKDQGKIFYQVDARRRGTKGVRERYPTKQQAFDRASAIELDFNDQGSEGLALDAETRVMAVKGKSRLEVFGKTIAEAVDYFEAHLKLEKAKAASATVSNLAAKWLAAKTNPNNRVLRKDTVDDIRKTSKILEKKFGSLRILEISESSMQNYLDSLGVGFRAKQNRRNLFSQFFNWCKRQGYTQDNPLQNIQIIVPEKEVQIFSVDECRALMKTCEKSFPALVPYFAISLFAGLRPNECKNLKWEQIHLDEMQITVLASTSKTRETRNVKIETTLKHWLESYSGKRSGYIVELKSCRTQMEKLRVNLGYKVRGENPDGTVWHTDICRHTFASYWLQKYNDRGHLAEQLGNSIKMIKKHYKQVVKSSDTEKFWAIFPSSVSEAQKNEENRKEGIISAALAVAGI